MQLPLESCWLVYSGLDDVMCTRSEIGSSFFSFSLFSPFDLFLFSCLFSSQASLPNNLTKALFCLQSLTPSFTLELKTIKVPRKELYLFLLGVLKVSLVGLLFPVKLYTYLFSSYSIEPITWKTFVEFSILDG